MRLFVAFLLGGLASLVMAGVHLFLQVDHAHLWTFMTVGFVAGFIGSIARRT